MILFHAHSSELFPETSLEFGPVKGKQGRIHDSISRIHLTGAVAEVR